LLPILSAYNARFDLADQSLNTPIHLAAMFNQGKAIKFMVQRGGTTKTKNIDNQLPIKLAKIRKSKDARKNIRLVEKKHYNRKITSPKSNPDRDYKIHFYDWLQERTDRLLRRFHQVENPSTHRVTSKDLKQIIAEEGFTQINSDDLNDLIIQHETNPNEIDYQTFLSGKLFIEKPFLMQTFIRKSKKKKKKGKKKTKKQVPIPIAIRHEGPRTSKGNPPLVYIRKHQFITDLNRFNRDQIPKHILQDDSMYYLDKIDPQFVHINNAGR
jgi:ankyrin repeat protein